MAGLSASDLASDDFLNPLPATRMLAFRACCNSAADLMRAAVKSSENH